MAKTVDAARCKSCGKLMYPIHFYCLACKGREFEPVPIEGDGTLLTWTRSYALPLDYAQLFLTLGIIQMDQGIRVTGQLDIADPKTGMRVRAHVGKVRETMGKDIHGLIFQPVRG